MYCGESPGLMKEASYVMDGNIAAGKTAPSEPV